MHSVSHALDNGRRRSLIIPITDIVMACHLAPDFDHLDDDELGPHVDVLATGRRFFLNHFYNYFFFQFMRYWRRYCST